MLSFGAGWLDASMRTVRAVRDVGWWMRLSVRQAVAEAVVEEGNRLLQEMASMASTPHKKHYADNMIKESAGQKDAC